MGHWDARVAMIVAPMLVWMSAVDALMSGAIPLWFAWVYDPMWKRMA